MRYTSWHEVPLSEYVALEKRMADIAAAKAGDTEGYAKGASLAVARVAWAYGQAEADLERLTLDTFTLMESALDWMAVMPDVPVPTSYDGLIVECDAALATVQEYEAFSWALERYQGPERLPVIVALSLSGEGEYDVNKRMARLDIAKAMPTPIAVAITGFFLLSSGSSNRIIPQSLTGLHKGMPIVVGYILNWLNGLKRPTLPSLDLGR
jgi:hypothetical protein